MFSITSLNINLYLFLENLTFFVIATGFLVIVYLAWGDLKPFELPKPLPDWFKIWFGTVQIIGGILPISALIWWGFIQGYSSVLTIFIPYLIMLGLQIVSEIITLKNLQTVIWVMIPYLYLPYRFWQLYEGLQILNPTPELIWVRYLLIANLIVWIVNYLLDIAQLPRLLRWGGTENEGIS